MMRPAMFRWIGTGLCAALLVSGCNQAQRRPMAQRATPVVQATPVVPQATVVTQLPAPAPAPVAEPVAQPEKTLPAPVAKTETEMQPAAYTPPAPKDEPVKRRDFFDPTAKPSFKHADDYSWLVGELQYLHSHNAWRLRYASVDEDDKYGGGVTLVEAGRMNDFTSGQIVRVKGEVLEADPKEGFRYRVRSIEPVTNP